MPFCAYGKCGSTQTLLGIGEYVSTPFQPHASKQHEHSTFLGQGLKLRADVAGGAGPVEAQERALFPDSSNEDGGTGWDFREIAGRRRRGRRRRWRALFEGPLASVTTDRVAQPSDDKACGFTPRRSQQPDHPHPSLSGARRVAP